MEEQKITISLSEYQTLMRVDKAQAVEMEKLKNSAALMLMQYTEEKQKNEFLTNKFEELSKEIEHIKNALAKCKDIQLINIERN